MSDVPSGVLTVSGYGVRLSVDRGHLVAEWGAGKDRHARRFPRVHHHLERVVVLGHSGRITLGALRWLRDVGIPFLQIDHDGEVIATTLPETRGNPETVRAQVLAASNEIGFAIAKELVGWKLANQLRVLERIDGSEAAQEALVFFGDEVEATETGTELLNVEALAAKEYWGAWHELPISFDNADQVPRHWLTFGPRNAPWGGRRSSKAVTPGNAMLNYSYAVLEAETRFAAIRAGLDPGIGIYHATRRWRHSLVFDLMEPIRPEIDAFLLNLRASHRFLPRDFFETRHGVCRVAPPIARMISETAVSWCPHADRVARHVAEACHAAGTRDVRSVLARRQGTTIKGSRIMGPAKGNVARANRVRSQAAANRAWGANPSLDRIDFELDVLPELKGVPLRELARATGLSLSYCSGIRAGRQIPHKRHWSALLALRSKAS